MPRLTDVEQIWTVSATKEELQKGSQYAEITLPWTFNRMMLTTSSRGQQERGLNIAKGIVAQAILARILRERGLKFEEQDKSHRDEDFFDLSIPVKGEDVRFDFKSVNYYSNYDSIGRAPLTPELIVQNRGYSGPNWADFFPMLVPHTQINQDKQAFCFAIASSIDPRGDPFEDRKEFRLVAYPHGQHLPFFTFKRLCQARELADSGFYIRVVYQPDTFLATNHMELELVGEWAGEIKREHLWLKANEIIDNVGPFSCLSAFRISRQILETFDGQIAVDVTRNDFKQQVRNSTGRNINVPPDDKFRINFDDFCNLNLPEPYDLHILGWIEKEDFLHRFRKYSSWVWPNDSIDKRLNQKWSQLTVNDINLMNRLGIDAQRSADDSMPAGLLKTHGKGGGACCYVFPNVPRRGGVNETNLYVLPQDLKPMETLVP